jgi:hypothetical protein
MDSNFKGDSMTTKPTLQDILITDLWAHLGGLIAIAIGLFGDKYLNLGLGQTAELLFIFGGFGVMGLKFTNGTAAAINTSVATAVADALKATASQTAAALVASTATATAAGTPVPVPVAPLPTPMIVP